MRKRLLSLLAAAHRRLQPNRPEPLTDDQRALRLADSVIRDLTESREVYEDSLRRDYVERAAELIEAKQMAGAGPWLVAESRADLDKPTRIRESNPITSQGAFGDIELALQNVEWRREVNLSWLEFSRWGIQQIILITRLYYIKNPLVRRLIDIAAYYVFGRGVEVSSPDEDANEVLRDFFERNKKTLGPIALVELEKRKYYDGNLFFAFFPDQNDTGQVSVRTIDATEIMDIVTDPDDTDTPWFYRRSWVSRNFDILTGQVATKQEDGWYPALGHDPDDKPLTINAQQVHWDTPILHRKCGHIAKWHFGCPIIYPALDWAKASRRFLEACATVKAALAQIAMTLTTKGGQQALEGAKQQLQTNIGPSSSLWDTNPTAVNASIFASGPGTTLAAFQTRGGGGDPEEVRQYKLMCCIVVGVPETFLGDVKTGNLATATSLDRPTELCFLEKQEAWREDLVTIAQYVLKVSNGAPSGRIRASRGKVPASDVVIREAARVRLPDGRMVYESPKTEAGKPITKPGVIEVKATFPAIREGDVPALIGAAVQAMTLGNKGGQVVGIDEKEGVRRLFELSGIENGDEILEEMYPNGEYDPDRTKEPLPAPIPTAPPIAPGGAPQAAPGQPVKAKPPGVREALTRLKGALAVLDDERNGHSH